MRSRCGDSLREAGRGRGAEEEEEEEGCRGQRAKYSTNLQTNTNFMDAADSLYGLIVDWSCIYSKDDVCGDVLQTRT